MAIPYRRGGVSVTIGVPCVVTIDEPALRVLARASGAQPLRLGHTELGAALTRLHAAEGEPPITLALHAGAAATGISLSLHPGEAARWITGLVATAADGCLSLEAPPAAIAAWEGIPEPVDPPAEGALDAPGEP